MNGRKVAVIVGSIRKDSLNRTLANALIKLAPEQLKCEILQIDDLPVFNQDLEKNPPEAVVRLKSKIVAADAVLFVTPEHNRSIPAALKNALDWASRPHADSVWVGKPAGVCGASPGPIRSACAQQHLRNMLACLDMPTMGQPGVYVHFTQGLIDNDGNVSDEGTRKFLQKFIDRYVAWVERLAAASAQ